MRLEVYDDPESQAIVKLKLVQQGDAIAVKAVTPDGTAHLYGTLAIISKEGIFRSRMVNNSLGFILDQRNGSLPDLKDYR